MFDLFFLFFRINIFTSSASNLLLPLGAEDQGPCILIYSINLSMMLLLMIYLYIFVAVVAFAVVIFRFFDTLEGLIRDSQDLIRDSQRL